MPPFVLTHVFDSGSHPCVSQALHEQLVLAEGKLSRGVEQLAADQQLLPNQLVGATERLQALVDSMQQDAAGQSGERQNLMAEVMSLRARLNAASGETVMLKEELVQEKQEKMELSRQLLSAQLSGTESTAKEQQRVFEVGGAAACPPYSPFPPRPPSQPAHIHMVIRPHPHGHPPTSTCPSAACAQPCWQFTRPCRLPVARARRFGPGAEHAPP